MKEKNDLITSSSLLKKELDLVLSNNENLSKSCAEKFIELSQFMEELIVRTSKIEELSVVEKKYNEALQKLEKMEAEAQSNLNILTSKTSKIEELSVFEKKYNEAVQKLKKMEADAQSNLDILTAKEHKIDELLELKIKYDEHLLIIKDFEESLNLKSEELQLKDDKIKELNYIEEKYVTALNDIMALKKDLSSKDELLISKEQNIEELNDVEKNYFAALEKIKKLEDDVKHKISLLGKKDEKIVDLNKRLSKKTIECDKKEYENLEMIHKLEKEKESVQICLECEIMKNKIQDLEHLQNTLENTEKELINQRQKTSDVVKMLNETEENFDQMRIKKEKEIIKCKDTIQSLQHELRILKVDANDAEKLKSEIFELQSNIKELALQNTGDMQRFKLEIEKLKIENDSLKTGKDMSVSDIEIMLKKQLEVDTLKKIHKLNEGNKTVEADSSFDAIISEENIKPTSTPVMKTCKLANKKVKSKIESQSTPLLSEKRKRAWETESSDSECLEIVFDKGAKKVMGFTPKSKTPMQLKKSPVNTGKSTPLLNKRQLASSQEKRRDMLKIMDEEEHEVTKTVISFSTKDSPMNWKSAKGDENKNFLSSKINIKEITPMNSPWREQNAEIKRTPSTPADRKFFKTPLKEREQPFKKPQLEKLWF